MHQKQRKQERDGNLYKVLVHCACLYCTGAHMQGPERGLQEMKVALKLTASKEMGTSAIQPQGIEFCHQPE